MHMQFIGTLAGNAGAVCVSVEPGIPEQWQFAGTVGFAVGGDEAGGELEVRNQASGA